MSTRPALNFKTVFLFVCFIPFFGARFGYPGPIECIEKTLRGRQVTSSEIRFKPISDAISHGKLRYIKPNVGYRPVSDLKTYAQARYGEVLGTEVYDALFRLNPDYTVLVVDPGLVLRHAQFLKVMEKQSPLPPPWEARELFSRSLGDKILYRAVSLGPEDYQRIQKEGMKSNGLRKSSLNSDEIGSVQTELAFHSGGLTGQSQFLSVTAYPALAIAVAKSFLRNPNEKLYLYQLKVPELDIIHTDDLFRSHELTLGVRINTETVPIDRNLESFVLGQIHPEDIIQVEPVSAIRQRLSNYEHVPHDESKFRNLWNFFQNIFEIK